jgi:hypothetical protein
MEILAAILYFSNFAFSAAAAVLAVMLFRHYRHCGWLLLTVAFLSPFGFLLLRFLNGRPLFTYIGSGSDAYGFAHVTIRYDIPGFYMLVVAALLLLIRDARRSK